MSFQVSKGAREGVTEGGREGGRTNKRPGTDYVISRPIEKMHLMAQTDRQTNIKTDGHGDSITESAQWGRFSENTAARS